MAARAPATRKVVIMAGAEAAEKINQLLLRVEAESGEEEEEEYPGWGWIPISVAAPDARAHLVARSIVYWSQYFHTGPQRGELAVNNFASYLSSISPSAFGWPSGQYSSLPSWRKLMAVLVLYCPECKVSTLQWAHLRSTLSGYPPTEQQEIVALVIFYLRKYYVPQS